MYTVLYSTLGSNPHRRELLTIPAMTQTSIKGKFATDDDTERRERRRMAALEAKKRLEIEEESEGLGDDQEGIINLSIVLPVELTGANTEAFTYL